MKTLSLAGTWSFSLDREDRGIQEQWYAGVLPGQAVLPGSLAVQGLGEPAALDRAWTGTIFNRVSFESPAYAAYRAEGNIKMPFWLQPETVHVGAAWFERDVEIPADWVGKHVVLTLERAHWFTKVWLNGRELGAGESLSTPHRFDLGEGLKAGSQRLTIRVDNRVGVAVGENAHSVSDHTQGNWNGVIGRMELSLRGVAWFEELRLEPVFADRTVRVSGHSGGATGCRVLLSVGDGPVLSVSVDADGGFRAVYPLGAYAVSWDEHRPVLHRLVARLLCGNEEVDTRCERFGLREIGTRGTQFMLNGRPLFLRGTLECCIFPLTGHPPMDTESWRRVLRAVKAHGLNHVRFHSWCPPEAAFIAGDELGLYFQVEAATWPNAVAVEAGSSPAGIGDGRTVDAWLYEETARILKEYGNHPCFVLMAAGNEPGGPKHAEFLEAWVRHFRAQDSQRLFTGTAGWPELPANQFHVIPEPRGHQWLDGLKSRFNREAPATTLDYRESIKKRAVPLVSHEIGQWCSYPPLADRESYTGHLKARNYEIFAESLAASGQAGQLEAFVQASGKLQALCYKEEIEAALRTPGMGGFQLLDLRDFPGQGTAPVGVLNAFWESKGYITAEQFRRFCAPTVLLARLSKRVFRAGETFSAKIEVAHFGESELRDVCVCWRVEGAEGTVLAAGELLAQSVGFGSGLPLGEISLRLAETLTAMELRLVVELAGTEVGNDWKLWVYPELNGPTKGSDILQVSCWTAEARETLERGGKVLLSVPARDPNKPAPIELGFTPIFWNTWCTKGQAPHTLGILCDPKHPSLESFPTENHTDWNWWYLLNRSSALLLDGLPSELRPLVQVIDDWYSNRRLGLVIEVKLGRGSLIVSGVDLSAPEDPVKAQFLSSLLSYMQSEAFQPKVGLCEEALVRMLERI